MFRLCCILPAAVLALAALPAPAQYTWTGGGTDANWSTAGNWSGGTVPVSSIDAAVAFAGSTNLAPNQNVASPFLLNSLTFAPFAGNFTLGGNGLDFRTNSSATAPTIVLGSSATVNNAITLTGALTVSGPGNSTFAGVIGGAGGLTFSNTNGNSLTLTAADIYTGATVVNGGTLTLSGANGSATSSSGFSVNFSTLSLDSSAANNTNRVGNVPVTLNGGTLSLAAANVSGGTTESYGNLVLSAGSCQVIVTATTNGGATLASTGSLVRSAGALGNMTGNNLGNTPGAGVSNITFATAPTVVGGGGAAGSQTISILPYVVAATTSTQPEFATYGTNGVRPLTGAEYATTITNGASTLTNVLVNSAITGINNPTTVNALKMWAGGSIAGTGTLTVNSGLIYMQQQGSGSSADIAVTTLAFGSREAIIRTIDPIYIDSSITGSGGLTVDSPGNGGWDVNLRGNSSFTGAIQAHTALGFTQDASLGAATNTVTLDRTGVLAYVGSGALTTSRGITLNGGGSISAATGQTLTVAGAITGTGPLQIGTSIGQPGGQSPNGIVELTGTSNSYTGGTTIGLATLQISSENVLPAGPLTVNGTLQAGGPLTIARAVTSNNGTIDTNGFDVTINGAVSGNTFYKKGAGTLSLSGINTYTGQTVINGGTLLAVIPAALPGFNASGSVIVANAAAVSVEAGGSGWTATNIDALASHAGFITGSALGMDVSAAVGNFSYGSNLAGSEGLVKSGAGTLTLGGAVTLTGPVTVNGGTLQIGAGGSVSSPVSVASGATLDLNGVGIALASLTGAGSVTLGGATLTINNSAATLFGGSISGAGGLTKMGTGTFTLSGTNSFSGQTSVTAGTLQLGSGTGVPANASLSVSSGATFDLDGNSYTTAGIVGAGTVTLGGATLTVNDATSETMTAGITGAGGLTKTGAGDLTLTGPLSYTGMTAVNGGRLIISSLGSSSGFTIGSSATLRFAGASYNLGFQFLQPAAGGTVEYAGAAITGGFLYGPGTHSILAAGATFAGTTSYGSAVINQSGPATFMSFTNGGALNLTTGANLTGFTNQGSGAITVGAGSAINASDFQTYGMLALTPNTAAAPTILTNTGTSPLSFNGGSQTFIGTPATADPTGQNVVDYIDLHGNNAIVAGGLFVNNGGVFDTVGAGTGTIIAEFGALVKGAGFYQNTVKTQNGGKFQTGNSPGSATFGSFVFGPGGVNNYVFAIDDATGTAGPSPNAAGLVSGWGLIKAVQVALGAATTSGSFTWTATPSNPLTVAIDTLVNPTMVGTDVAGPMADFDPAQSYSWTAARWTGVYAGPTDAAMLDADTSFDTSGIVNPSAGTFGWALDPAGQTLSLVYTPSSVPEPGAFALLAAAALAPVVRHRLSGRRR